MNKYIVERTDGQTDHVEADIFNYTSNVLTFCEIIDPLKILRPSGIKIIRAYPLHAVISVMPYEEINVEELTEETRRKNENEDLISRNGLLNFLKTHWSSNVIEVIQTFEKAEYLD